ncbi:MAG: YbjQ family protein [Candidatus Izimaplasma sp.]|nr:YbjQ family protein [Candidatus Izimaplasma bacterium]
MINRTNLVTINDIPGKEITEVLGYVKGSVVQSKNIGHDFLAGLKTIVGGEIKGYSDMMTEARQIATERLLREADDLGADAIIGFRLQTSSVMGGAAEIIAYGTAVKLK